MPRAVKRLSVRVSACTHCTTAPACTRSLKTLLALVTALLNRALYVANLLGSGECAGRMRARH